MSHDCHMTHAGDGPVSHDTGDVGGEDHQLVCTAPRNAQVDSPSPSPQRGECETRTWAPPPLLRERRARVYRNYFATCILVPVCC